MYHPTTRVLTVLELLQSRARISGPELARRLEVDARTVRRYVAMLQELGIPVEAGRGRYGAYRLRPGYKLPPLLFSDAEALAVVLSLVAARRLHLTLAAPAAEGALAKIERVLPEALRERLRALEESLVLAGGVPAVAPESALVLALGEAARHRRRVWLRYRSYTGDESAREVDPYSLVYRAGRWYLAGHCHLRGDVRTFRLDRVLAVEPREASFELPEDFDALAAVERGIASVPQTWVVEVELATTLERARRRVPPAFATLEPLAEERMLLRCSVEDLDRAAHFVAGLSCPFIIRQPPELREALRRLAEHIAEALAAGEGAGR
jgi:predicted DNA-binding transcriptional regulator YafY